MTDTENAGPPTHILLVEDEEHLAFTLRFNLEAEDYRVVDAGSLAGARRCIADAGAAGGDGIDLVVLDAMLPDGSGIDLLEELRAAGHRMPVLMLTALGGPDDVVKGLDAGADDYLGKPFALEVLLGRIRALLRRREWTRTPPVVARTLRFGDNAINLSTGEGTAFGKPIRLTDLELRLLRYLANHPDEPVARGALLEHIWDLPPTAATRTVDNFIARLRRYFEPDPRKPRHLLTAHGTGYRFVADP